MSDKYTIRIIDFFTYLDFANDKDGMAFVLEISGRQFSDVKMLTAGFRTRAGTDVNYKYAHSGSERFLNSTGIVIWHESLLQFGDPSAFSVSFEHGEDFQGQVIFSLRNRYDYTEPLATTDWRLWMWKTPDIGQFYDGRDYATEEEWIEAINENYKNQQKLSSNVRDFDNSDPLGIR